MKRSQEIISNQINITIAETPDEAPKYHNTTTMLKLTKCIIVGNGTQAGKPTVDLQMIDTMGRKYLVTTTGAIIEGLAGVIKGVELKRAYKPWSPPKEG